VTVPTLDPAAFPNLFLSSHGMLLADDERRLVAVNPAACRLLGVSSEELVGKRVDDLTPPELAPALEGIWKRFLAEGTQTGDYEFLLPGGERRQFEYSAVARIEPGRHLGVMLATPTNPEGDWAQGEQRVAARGQRLSPRERQVMTCLAAGSSGPEVARLLQISPETVRNHTRSARYKLGARTRAQAMALAVRNGEISVLAAGPGA
jgi:PAS domain S-box-containing protein